MKTELLRKVSNIGLFPFHFLIVQSYLEEVCYGESNFSSQAARGELIAVLNNSINTI